MNLRMLLHELAVIAVEIGEDSSAFEDKYREIESALQEATRWIPVGERLPEEYKSILLLTPNENIVIGSREGDRYMIEKPPDDWGFGHGFTHWMHLPVPPEGGE